MEAKKAFTDEDAMNIGINLGIKWDKFNSYQFMSGLNVELEHGKVNPGTNVSNDDLLTTAKITLAHLNEFPDYYIRLKKMEKEAKDYWDNKD